MSKHVFVRRGLTGVVTGALVAAPLVLGPAAPANAAPGGTGLVISEVYGGGGNAGATLTHDFIELYNPTGAAIDVGGWSVQWRSGGNTGAASGVTPLTGSVPAGGHYLVQQAKGTGGAVALPTPNATGTIAMGGTNGTAILSNGTTPIDPGVDTVATNAAIIDLVGVNSNVWEGAAKAPAMSNTTSVARSATGVDTDNNGADLAAGATSPRNAAGEGPAQSGPCGTAIADIQGTGAASPCVGQTATTRGVVTAIYPGSLDGFYLQTGGTGGATDATPGASDAIFVYGGTAFDGAGLAIGDSVEVTGAVSEFSGSTQITVAAAGITEVTPALAPVTPLAIAYPTTEVAREAHEGELLAPTDTFTVTNTFSTNQYAEIGLATGDQPLIQPTEVAAVGTPEYTEVVADNARRAVTLDDGASINFLPFGGGDNQNIPLPWLSRTNAIRVGAEATLEAPVVLEYRNSAWKFQPTEAVTDEGTDVATFEDTRAQNLAPQDVGGSIKLGTFNVLNYFNTTGADFVGRGGSCTFYEDREGDPVSVNTCTPNGPRGAAELGDFRRQQAKIVRAINTLDADVVSLEEIENSVKLLGETDRDDALRSLVTALNADAGTRRWAFAPSPAAADLPPVAAQDVIRTAFIYDPTVVSLAGASKVLVGSTAFTNARQPLAQAFKPVGTGDAEAFAVVVNHFKSKGNSTPPATGDNANGPQGAFNGDRVRQAQALTTFANQFAADRGIEKVFLTGDFNAYSAEDPVVAIEAGGFSQVESDTEGDYSYSFSGLSGSLDHVFANEAAMDMVTGADVWEINANESIAFQYSRRNYNATQFFSAGDPFAASDHNPEVVGLQPDAPTTTEVQLLATNDFHGRLLANGAEGGAAVLSGAVKQLDAENPNSLFVAAGDLIGASTFESFIQDDEPTIDALNEAGLDVSAAGNHEFDKGYEDLVGRVQDRADWEYIAANIEEPAGRDDLAESWTQTFGDIEVGFVGAVTEDLPTLVAPDGIEGVTVTDIVEATNTEATALRAAGADLVVLLVHEGAPSTAYADAVDPGNAFGAIVNGVSADVDAIVSGHTHLAYNHSVPVPAWVSEGRAVTERPVVSAGQYGSNLNQLKFQFDADGNVTAKSQGILPLTTDVDGSGPGTVFTANYPVDAPTKAIVDDAVAEANVLGAVKVGEIEGPFYRAKLADGTTENRGGESTLGNLVAEIQQWATETPEAGASQIAFMNPGGLRADLVGTFPASPAVVNYRQAATVQPFANTLVNMNLTGAQLEEVLEEQWQPAGSSRPFLKLGISEGFTYSYVPPAAGAPAGTKGEVIGMWLDGDAVSETTTYSVTVNSFLASGGDGFSTLAEGSGTRDTGKSDLQAQVDYFDEFASTSALPVDYSQRAVGATFPAGAPATYAPGDDVAFDLSSLSMTGPNDTKDASVEVSLDGESLGTFPVTTTVLAALPGYDEAGTASVSVTLPAGVAAGEHELLVTGDATGTEVAVPVTVEGTDEPQPPVVAKVTADVKPNKVKVNKTKARVVVTVRGDGQALTGWVRVKVTGQKVKVVKLVNGRAVVTLAKFAKVGKKTVTVRYNGSGDVAAVTKTLSFRVVR
ncbi:ExeM/NucH family extracellular endonuclease [Nocardioides dongxiaopingii]|uniref:ExeM/NucH family extracellular endonuclease n=1 Tax=Nocardioides dongxiaopingii TaxID=2576036 RepID=UPI0010C7638E|nr:ExeM/NucH family extracellular endonuclease [Nocardioides dongxiaopingii]